MVSARPCRLAVIGTGLIGPRHAEAILQCAEASLFCVVDPNPAARNVAERFGVECFSSVEEMIAEKGRPDGALVCTPNSSHVAVSKQLLKAGVHVLCEKPVSTTLSEGQELIECAEAEKLHLLVGHHRRFNPYVSATKAFLQQGSLGQVIAVSGLWCTYKPTDYFAPPTDWRRGSKGGPILINLIHEVDVLMFLLGPIVRVSAERTISQRGFEAEEGCAVLLRFQSGVVGTFVLSDAVPSPHNFESGTGENPTIPRAGRDVYRIFGTEGTLSVPDMKWSSHRGLVKSWTEPVVESPVDIVEQDVPFVMQIRHFVKVIGGLEEPICSGRDGLRAVAVCEAVKQAMDTGFAVDIIVK